MSHESQTTAQLIARGRALHNTIATYAVELKIIEAILRSRALAIPHDPLKDQHREGRRATLSDDGHSVTVTFESDLLKASFAASTPLANTLQSTLTAADFDTLFSTKTTHECRTKDGHKFRQECADLFPTELAALVIDTLKDRDKNGIPKSKSVVEW
jgi:hypothetical protein